MINGCFGTFTATSANRDTPDTIYCILNQCNLFRSQRVLEKGVLNVFSSGMLWTVNNLNTLISMEENSNLADGKDKDIKYSSLSCAAVSRTCVLVLFHPSKASLFN